MKKKVNLLINSLAGGGAERAAINLANALNINKIFLLEKDIRYNLPKEKISFLSNFCLKTNAILKNIYIPIYVKKLINYIDKNSLIISFLERANYVNIITSLFTKHKAIISVHTSQIQGRRIFHPYNLLNMILYPKAFKVICVSKSIANELKNFYKVSFEKIKVINNPICINEIANNAQNQLGDYKAISKYPFLINVGRLARPKGQWYLLRIFKELKKEFTNLKLLILGEGKLKNYLVSLSENLGLKTYVWDRDKFSENFDTYFLGFQKNPFKFIARAKFFILPSLWEGFPNVLIESMACGVPVISSDCRSGPREILAPNTDFQYQTSDPELSEYGILMPVFDSKYKASDEPLSDIEIKWIETLRKVLKDESLRKNYLEKGKERIENFKIEKIKKEWEELLKD